MPKSKKSHRKGTSAKRQKANATQANMVRSILGSQIPGDYQGPLLYTLKVQLIQGRVTEEFEEQNPEVSRTMEMLGDQTFEEFHATIFNAFGRFEEHMYEFQFGKKPQAPGLRVAGSTGSGIGFYGSNPERLAFETTFDEVIVKKGQKFFYWFDFGDDWWHEITVQNIGVPDSAGTYPQVTEIVGQNPPQYPDHDEDEDYDDDNDYEDEDDE